MRWRIQSWFPQTIKTCTSTYTPCHYGPCVQLLLLTYSCGTFFIDIPDVWVWVICLLVMPVLSPPTGHLTVYEASAERKHSPHQWELRSEQNRRVFSARAKTTVCLVQFRLFKCFSGRTCEELNRAIWEHADENVSPSKGLFKIWNWMLNVSVWWELSSVRWSWMWHCFNNVTNYFSKF